MSKSDFVGRIAPLAAPAAMLWILASACAASTANAATIYDESIDGDLSSDSGAGQATDLGALGSGSQTILVNDAGGTFDRDYFTFEVGAENTLTQFRLSNYADSSPGFASIEVKTGQDPAQGSSLEFINWDGSPSSLDLLAFDSAPGAQPGGNYVVSISYFNSSLVNYALAVTAVLTLVPPIYDESVDGDLSSDLNAGQATDLGLLGVGSQTVLVNDAGGLFDSDHFTFEVGAENTLTEFRLSNYTDSAFGFASIVLETGQDPFQGTGLGFINWNGLPSSLDLLAFDSGPGAQPGGDYVVSVSYNNPSIVNYALAITAVVAPVPEPGAGELGAITLFGIAAIRNRRAR